MDPLSQIVTGADPELGPAVRLANIERRLNTLESGRAGGSDSLYLESLPASQIATPIGFTYLTDFPVGKLYVPSADAIVEAYLELKGGGALTGGLVGSTSRTTRTWLYTPDGAGAFIYPYVIAGDGAGGEQFVGQSPQTPGYVRLDAVPNLRGGFVAIPARQLSVWTGLTFPGPINLTLRTDGNGGAGAGLAITVNSRRLWARARS